MTRNELDTAVLEWIAEGVGAAADDERFNALALALFEHQYAGNPAYRSICAAFGRALEDVKHWTEIPAVPTGAFKEARIASFPPDKTVLTFRTSGSTTAARGRLELDTLAVYQASLLATFGHYLCLDASLRFAILAPDAAHAPDSLLCQR